jgi:hypothetical protein
MTTNNTNNENVNVTETTEVKETTTAAPKRNISGAKKLVMAIILIISALIGVCYQEEPLVRGVALVITGVLVYWHSEATDFSNKTEKEQKDIKKGLHLLSGLCCILGVFLTFMSLVTM